MVRRSLVLVSLSRYGASAISFLTLAITARLLTPGDFGVVAIGLAVITVFEALREFGTSTFIIQAPSLSRQEIRTAFTVMLTVTAGLVAAAWLLTAPLARFVNAPGLSGYLEITLPGLMAGPVIATVLALMRRNMMFGTVAAIETAGMVTQGSTTILLAWLGYKALSFAYASVLASVVTAALCIVVYRDVSIFRPSFAGWRGSARFAAYDGVTTILNRLWDMAPPVVFGRMIGIEAVGLYGRASAICQWPEKVLFAGLSSVLLPVFAAGARAGHDRKSAYFRVLGLITVLQWPALIMLIILAEPAVRLMLGGKWLEVVPLVQIIATAMLSWFPAYLTYPVLVSTGGLADTTRSSLISLPVSAAILLVAAPHGLTAVAYSMCLIMPAQVMVALWFVKRRVGFTWWEWLASLWRSLAVAAGSAAAALFATVVLGFNHSNSIGGGLGILAFGAAGWVAGVILTWHPVMHELSRAYDYLRVKFGAVRFAADA